MILVEGRYSQLSFRCQEIGNYSRFLSSDSHISHSGSRCKLGGIGDEFGQVLLCPDDIQRSQGSRCGEAGDVTGPPADHVV